MFEITLDWRPHAVMPVGNPIQYAFTSDRTTRPDVDIYSCSVTGLLYSYFSNDVLHMDAGGGAPTPFSDTITIMGDTYIFANCADLIYLDSPYYIDLGPYLASGDFCDLAAAIIDAINNNPDANGRYFAVEIGGSLDTDPPGVILSPASDCTGGSLTIRIVSARIDLDLNVGASGWPGYGGNTPWLGPTRTPARNYFTNYRLYLYVFEETGDFQFGAFAQSKKLTALPVPFADNLPLIPVLWVNPVRQFVFDIAAELRAHLAHDVPDAHENKVRFCFRCLKRYYISFGEQRDGVGDGTVLETGVNISRMQYDLSYAGPINHIVLNAWLPIYDSDYATRETDNGASCIDETSAPFLLEPYFREDPELRDFLYTPGWQREDCETSRAVSAHQEGGFLWLHWWNDSLIDPSKLRVATQQRLDNGSEIGTVSSFDFSAVGNCETPASFTQQLLQIPIHAAINFAGVESIDIWLEYEGAAVSSELSFTVFEACDPMICLVFVNRLGVFQCLYLEASLKLLSNSEAETYEATRLGLTTPRHAPHNRGETLHYASAARVWEAEILLTNLVSREQMLDLRLSPDVRFVYQNELVPIRLDASNLQIERTPNTPPEYVTINLVESATRKYG